jgi:hypothetical protein
VWDDPPKTLSSRFQALSHLQPVEPPLAALDANGPERLPAPATPAAAERPLVPAKRVEHAVQNRSIGTLAGRAQARTRLACVQCTKSAQRGDLLLDFMATGRAIAEPGWPHNQAGRGVLIYTQSAF